MKLDVLKGRKAENSGRVSLLRTPKHSCWGSLAIGDPIVGPSLDTLHEFLRERLSWGEPALILCTSYEGWPSQPDLTAPYEKAQQRIEFQWNGHLLRGIPARNLEEMEDGRMKVPLGNYPVESTLGLKLNIKERARRRNFVFFLKWVRMEIHVTLDKKRN